MKEVDEIRRREAAGRWKVKKEAKYEEMKRIKEERQA